LHYTLYLEPEQAPVLTATAAAMLVDAQLSALNIEYAAKRESGRLGALTVRWLRAGSADAFKAFAIAHGQREAQFKIVAIDYRAKFKFEIEAWTMEPIA
jgi:GH3 auxin-responsive promoter